ncbi:EamA family transporter [candidate division KSB1 bacterium]|nr:EamA family transporter [candidate division KSB1 bacterium]
MATHVFIASGGFIMTKLALSEFTPMALGFWRLLFGLIALVAFMLTFKSWQPVDRGDWWKIGGLALLAVPINQVGYIYGMQFTVPSHAALLYGCTVVFTVLLSVMLGREHLRKSRIAAIIMAVSGVTIVISGQHTQILGTENFAGDLIVLAAVMGWASYTVLAKPLVHRYGATQATTMCLILGSLMGLPFLGVPAAMQDYSRLTWIGWSGALYAGILLTGVAYAVWFTLLKRIDPSQVAIATSPQPVVTTALSTVILGEVIRGSLIIGGILVIGGVFVMNAPELFRRIIAREAK